MHCAFEIETDLFKGTAPRPGAINELIGGDEIANWLHPALAKEGVELSAIWPDDHGWDFTANCDGKKYMIVCSCDFDDVGKAERQHYVQVAHLRTFKDKLFGRNKTDKNDRLLGIVRTLLTAHTGFTVTQEQVLRH